MAFLPAPPLPLPPARSRPFSIRHACPAMIRAPPTRPPTHLHQKVRPPSTAPPTTAAPDPDAVATVAAAAAAAATAAAVAVAAVSPSTVTPTTKTATTTPTAPVTVSMRPKDAIATILETSSRRDRQREYYYDDINPVNSTATRPKKKPLTPPPPPTTDPDQYYQPHDDQPQDSNSDPRHSKAQGPDGEPHRKSRLTNADDSIRSYLHEIGEVKLLDADTEVHLAAQIAQLLHLERISAALKEHTGFDPSIPDWADAAGMDIELFRHTLRVGLRAKEHMVAANLRLVVSIAKKYMNRGLTFQDLIQEGSIGLIRGAEKFDGSKGFKFSTYATWWIRQAITRAIADHSRPIRLPVHVNDTIAAIRKTTKQLHSEINRPPTEAEIANRMQLSIEKLRFLARSSRSTISLETPIGKDGRESNATLGSFIVWGGDSPEESTMKSLLREDLENVLDTLSPRERDVVRMRYGFDDGKMKTLEEIGNIFAVTRERIRQIEAKALRKLRHPNRNAVLREYVYEDQ